MRIRDSLSVALLFTTSGVLCGQTVAITEFVNNPAGEDVGREWVEIFNYGLNSVDLTGWSLDDMDFDSFMFPPGTVIPPCGYLILVSPGKIDEFTPEISAAQAKAVFEREWLGGVTDDRVLGMGPFELEDEDELVLADDGGSLRWIVSWIDDENDSATFLVEDDFAQFLWGLPGGPYIDRAGDDLDEPGLIGYERNESPVGGPLVAGDDVTAYESNAGAVQDPNFLSGQGLPTDYYDDALNGSWGSPLGGVYSCVELTVAITEFLNNADGEDAGREWVELYNYGTTALDLSGWTLSDEDDDFFVIPEGTLIDACDYLVFVSPGSLADLTPAQAKAVFEREWLGGVANPRVIGMTAFSLGNGEDELVLTTADSATAWRIAWLDDENDNATWLTMDTILRSDWGQKLELHIDRQGNDVKVQNYPGYERNNSPIGGPLDPNDDPQAGESDHLAIKDAGFLQAQGIPAGFYDLVDNGSWGSPLVGDYNCEGRKRCVPDTNCDGIISFGDVNPFVDMILYGVLCDLDPAGNGDVDGNGSVGFGDINPYVEIMIHSDLPMPCDYLNGH